LLDGNVKKACRVWLEVWEVVKCGRKNLGLFGGFFISNLCPDPEFELHNAGRTGFATLQALSRMISEVKASTVFGYGTIALRIR